MISSLTAAVCGLVCVSAAERPTVAGLCEAGRPLPHGKLRHRAASAAGLTEASYSTGLRPGGWNCRVSERPSPDRGHVWPRSGAAGVAAQLRISGGDCVGAIGVEDEGGGHPARRKRAKLPEIPAD